MSARCPDFAAFSLDAPEAPCILLAKKKGGIGRHVTKVVKRKVSPNLQSKRIWIPEFNQYVRMTLSCKAIKTINKNGAYATLKKAGLL